MHFSLTPCTVIVLSAKSQPYLSKGVRWYVTAPYQARVSANTRQAIGEARGNVVCDDYNEE